MNAQAVDHVDHDDHHHGPAKGWMRWITTTNHKDIPRNEAPLLNRERFMAASRSLPFMVFVIGAFNVDSITNRIPARISPIKRAFAMRCLVSRLCASTAFNNNRPVIVTPIKRTSSLSASRGLIDHRDARETQAKKPPAKHSCLLVKEGKVLLSE